MPERGLSVVGELNVVACITRWNIRDFALRLRDSAVFIVITVVSRNIYAYCANDVFAADVETAGLLCEAYVVTSLVAEDTDCIVPLSPVCN